MKVLVVNGADFSTNGIINVVSYSWLMGATNSVLATASSGSSVADSTFCFLATQLIGPKLVQKIKFRAEAAGTINFKRSSNGSLSSTLATVTVTSGEVGTIVTKDLSSEVELSDGDLLAVQTNDGCFKYKKGTSDNYRVASGGGTMMTVSIYVDVYCATPL